MTITTTYNTSSAIAWSPDGGTLAKGTVAGALDSSFSSSSQLVLTGNMTSTCSVVGRFNHIVWSSMGLHAALENGNLMFVSASELVSGGSGGGSGGGGGGTAATAAAGGNTLLHTTTPIHSSSFSLDVNSNLQMATAQSSNLLIHDLNSTPYNLKTTNDISFLQYNKLVPHILATASNNGYTSVWDLKQKKELMHLAHPSKKLITCVAWNPSQATQIATVADDDQHPIVLIWDLRNARAPERVFSFNLGSSRTR